MYVLACMHVLWCMWEIKGQLPGVSFFSPPPLLLLRMGPQDQTQVIGIWQQVPSLFDPFLPALVFVFFFFSILIQDLIIAHTDLKLTM